MSKIAKSLFEQRVRYALGALETYSKEFPFYIKQALSVFRGKRFGLMTAMEIYGAVAFPFAVYALARTISDGNLMPLEKYYATDATFTGAWLLYGRKEVENKLATALTVPLMPAYRLGVLVPARALAYLKFAHDAINDSLLMLYVGVSQGSITEKARSVTQKAVAVASMPLRSIKR